jgi:hypothetical protein
MRVVYDGTEFRLVELGAPWGCARRHAPTRGHDLYKVGTVAQEPPGEGSRFRGGVGRAPTRPQVPAGRGDWRAARQQTRPDQKALSDPVTQRLQEGATAPAVARGCHAGFKHLPRMGGAPHEQLVVVVRPAQINERLPSPNHQVDVRIDEARHRGRSRVLDDLCACRHWNCRRRPNRCDSIANDDNRGVVDNLARCSGADVIDRLPVGRDGRASREERPVHAQVAAAWRVAQ